MRELMSRFEVPVSESLNLIFNLIPRCRFLAIDGKRIGSDLTDFSNGAKGLTV
jgi:hypothetical protein